jgi:hypothetical protein
VGVGVGVGDPGEKSQFLTPGRQEINTNSSNSIEWSNEWSVVSPLFVGKPRNMNFVIGPVHWSLKRPLRTSPVERVMVTANAPNFSTDLSIAAPTA